MMLRIPYILRGLLKKRTESMEEYRKKYMKKDENTSPLFEIPT